MSDSSQGAVQSLIEDGTVTTDHELGYDGQLVRSEGRYYHVHLRDVEERNTDWFRYGWTPVVVALGGALVLGRGAFLWAK